MPEIVWVLVVLALSAFGFWLGRRSVRPSPQPLSTPPLTKPALEPRTATPLDSPSDKFSLPMPDEAELLGESQTSNKHNLFDKMPVVWDGNPQTSPRLPILTLPDHLLTGESKPHTSTAEKSWVLVFAAGEFPCSDIILDRSRLRVGRREGSDLHIPDTGVSKAHADVLLFPDGLAVIDLGSSNGTWLNGNKLPSSEPIPLKEGDRLAFSSFVFTVTARK
jgi:hypothetical protein